MDVVIFETTKEETLLITKIVRRAAKEGGISSSMDAEMDLAACHCNGTPLDLEILLAFPLGDFAHDVYGITRHINRTTGKLENCFLPRCAKKEIAQ